MRKHVASITFLSVLLFASCSQGFTPSSDVSNYEELMANKEEAANIFKNAQSEYQAIVNARFPNSARSITQEADSQDELSVEDQITSAAWMAYYTGDETNLIELLDEKGLYDDCIDIVNRYNLDKQQGVLNISSRSVEGSPRAVSADFITSNARRTGDILLCIGGGASSSSSLLGVVIPGHWKHAGLVDHNAPVGYAVLSASNATNTHLANKAINGRVGYETAEKWAGADSVIAMRVNNTSASQALAAVQYARQYIGKPFNFLVTRNTSENWYCSKLVWRAWQSQGKDLEYNTWYYWRGQWVTPQDIYDDDDTSYLAGDTW